MGRAAKLKRIRKLAKQFPELQVNVQKADMIFGADMIKSGITEVQGEEVIPDRRYRKVNKTTQPMNHERNLKRMYNQFGDKGIEDYEKAVQMHVQEQSRKQETLTKK